MGEPVEVWFNPSCAEGRAAREQLDEAGVDHRLHRYLDDEPSEAELRRAPSALAPQPWDITRLSEPLARELGPCEMERDAVAWIRVPAGHPQLIQRPLVPTGDGRAGVARDDATLTVVAAATRRADAR